MSRGGNSDTRRWRVLIVLCLVQFMLVVDDTVVNVALPTIKKDLNFSQADLAWVVNPASNDPAALAAAPALEVPATN